MTLTEFITARLGERAAAAQRAVDHATTQGWASEDDAWDDRGPMGITEWSVIEAARWTLSDVDAKRRLLDLHTVPHECPVWDVIVAGDTVTDYFGTGEPCPTMRLIGVTWAGRSDYDETWRPE